MDRGQGNLKMGGIGQGTSGDNTIKILGATIGLPIQLVSGYKDMAEIRLATERRGRLPGLCRTEDGMAENPRGGRGDPRVASDAKPGAGFPQSPACH